LLTSSSHARQQLSQQHSPFICLRDRLQDQINIQTAAMSSPSKSSTTTSQPLTDISPNTSSPTKSSSSSQQAAEKKTDITSTTDPFAPVNKDAMPTTRLEQAATYISPSDAMLSPTTKKLSEIKGRRFAGVKTASTSLNSKALFQRSMAANANAGKENRAVDFSQN
jgi:hypothetical protein